MEVFGKVKLNFQVSYIGCLPCKNFNSGPMALGESNGMQADSLLSSFRVVSSFFESEPASTFHSENSAAFLQGVWVFLFVCFSGSETSVHINTQMFSFIIKNI